MSRLLLSRRPADHCGDRHTEFVASYTEFRLAAAPPSHQGAPPDGRWAPSARRHAAVGDVYALDIVTFLFLTLPCDTALGLRPIMHRRRARRAPRSHVEMRAALGEA